MDSIKIQDIAAQLGLSRNTVAKALSGAPGVAEGTKLRVLKKAAELGYKNFSKTSAAAQKEPKTVLILTRTDVSLFWNSIIRGISEALDEKGFNVTIRFLNEEKEAFVAKLINNDLRLGIAGILVLSVYSDRFIRRVLYLGAPVVFLDTGIADSQRSFIRGDVVLPEGTYAVESLTRHLLSQGMKSIGFIGDITCCRSFKDRYEGCVTALKAAGIEPDPAIMATAHKPEKYYLKYEVEEALSGFGYIPEAVVCANDDIALHLIKCLNDRNIRVPEDVAVTGYDNLESLIAQLPPFLSTASIKHYELGSRLVRQLLWRMENPDMPKEIVLVRPEVIIRGSSAKMPGFVGGGAKMYINEKDEE